VFGISKVGLGLTSSFVVNRIRFSLLDFFGLAVLCLLCSTKVQFTSPTAKILLSQRNIAVAIAINIRGEA